MSHRLGSNLHTIDLQGRCSFCFGLTSAGVAPLPPCSHKLLDKTVKTFTVFASLLYLLDGEDNCMLSVPFSASDLHFSCWQSGDNFQGLSTGACTLLCHVLPISMKVCSSCFLWSCPRVCLLDVSCLFGLTLRPSAPVCCFLRDSLGGLAVAHEAVRGPPFSSIGSAHDDMCPVTSGSFREMSVQALIKFEDPAIM